MNEKELLRIRELEAKCYVAVGGPRRQNDDWDADICPAALDPRLIREREEMVLRARDRKPAAASKEALAELIEENRNSARHREALLLHQEEKMDYIQGRIFHINTFLKELKKINLTFEYNQFSAFGLRGLNCRNNSSDPLYFATTVQTDYMPEFSQYRLDNHGHVVSERFRGWRDVLMVLIENDIIKAEDALRVFGDVQGPRKNWWGRKLYCRRNNVCPLCEKRWCICKNRWEDLRADKYSRLPDVQEFMAMLRKKK
jgi:hypothetical protein